jgi:hypothetical protein
MWSLHSVVVVSDRRSRAFAALNLSCVLAVRHVAPLVAPLCDHDGGADRDPQRRGQHTGIVIGRTRNRFARAIVTTEKPCEGDNYFMTDLSVGIAGKHFNEIGYYSGDANVSVSTPFTRDSMKSTFADERDRIAQCLAKGFE